MKKTGILFLFVTGVVFSAQAQKNVEYDKSCDAQKANIVVDRAPRNAGGDMKVTNHTSNTAVKATATTNNGWTGETRIAPGSSNSVSGADSRSNVKLECSPIDKK